MYRELAIARDFFAAGVKSQAIRDYKRGMPSDAVEYTIETLVQIDTAASYLLVADYVKNCPITDTFVLTVLDAAHFCGAEGLASELLRRLVKRNSPLFFKRNSPLFFTKGSGGTLRICSNRIRRNLHYIPPVATLQIDGGLERDVGDILDDWNRPDPLIRLDYFNFQTLSIPEAVRTFGGLQFLTIADTGELMSLDVLSSLGRLDSMAILDVHDLHDVEGLRYSESLKNLFLCGIQEDDLSEILRTLRGSYVTVFLDEKDPWWDLSEWQYEGRVHKWPRRNISKLARSLQIKDRQKL